MRSLLAVYGAKPLFGVAWTVEAAPAPLEQLREARAADGITIVGDDADALVDPTAVYYAEAMKAGVEGLPAGISIEPLWSVV